jgi:hypothetical protein
LIIAVQGWRIRIAGGACRSARFALGAVLIPHAAAGSPVVFEAPG